jgi:hypothetical protein
MELNGLLIQYSALCFAVRCLLSIALYFSRMSNTLVNIPFLLYCVHEGLLFVICQYFTRCIYRFGGVMVSVLISSSRRAESNAKNV